MDNSSTSKFGTRTAIIVVTLVALAVPSAGYSATGALGEHLNIQTGKDPQEKFPDRIEKDDSISFAPSTGPLIPEESADDGSPRARAVQMSPAGCVVSTNYPHSSNGKTRTKYGPYASIHGETKCKTRVTSVTATAQLYRYRWYGEQFLMTGKTVTKVNSNWSGRSTPHYLCAGQGTFTYIGYTFGKSIENGKTYTGTSRNTTGDNGMSRFNCR